MPNITSLHIYPVKGLRGVDLSRAFVEPRGLRYDRRWMLVDDELQFRSQRNTPGMAAIELRLEADCLSFSAPGQPPLTVPLCPVGDPSLDVTVWNSTVPAIAVSDEADAWFTQVLGAPSQLVYMPDTTQRQINPNYAQPEDIVSFADAFPILVTTLASLADLNGRLETPVPMNRFRANVVVDGMEAWSEDDWEAVQLGAVPTRAAKRCGRCLVTTMDQQTGEGGIEPLKTLATFRQQGQTVIFGTYVIPDATGEIAVGDCVGLRPFGFSQ